MLTSTIILTCVLSAGIDLEVIFSAVIYFRRQNLTSILSVGIDFRRHNLTSVISARIDFRRQNLTMLPINAIYNT